MDREPRTSEDDVSAEVLRRVRWMAVAAYVVFALGSLISSGFHAFLGLTCSAAVTMISFLWLEEIVHVFLQPAAHLDSRRMITRTLMRFALLGVALTVTIFVARFHALSVLLGFSIIVVGIIGEAVYSTYRSFTE